MRKKWIETTLKKNYVKIELELTSISGCPNKDWTDSVLPFSAAINKGVLSKYTILNCIQKLNWNFIQKIEFIEFYLSKSYLKLYLKIIIWTLFKQKNDLKFH